MKKLEDSIAKGKKNETQIQSKWLKIVQKTMNMQQKLFKNLKKSLKTKK